MGHPHGQTRLAVLGSSSAVPRPGRANSGYLLLTERTALVLDLGTGAFSRLRSVADASQIDAVLISHMHADHFLDLVPLRYAMKYEIKRQAPLPVYLPPQGRTALEEVVHPFGQDGSFFEGIIDIGAYAEDTLLSIGDCRISFYATRHYIPAYAMRVETPGGVFAFSADSAPCEALAKAAKGARMFLCEAALGPRGSERGKRGHLSAAEAGKIGADAGVEHLVLTHYGARADLAELRAAAAETFAGRITVADDGMELALQ